MNRATNSDTVQQWVVVITFIATLASNALANILPYNNITTGEVSDSFRVFFVPAAYVFSIWSLIYLLLGAFTVYQAQPAQRENPRLRSVRNWVAAANLFNAVWMLAWHYYQLPLSLGLMLALLACLIVVYLRLEIGRKPVTGIERWVVNLPFSIYLGWITVATVANATNTLDFLGWSGAPLDPRAWAAVMLAVASVVGLLMLLTRRDAAYLLVLVWAFVGIAVKFPAEALVPTAAWVSAAAVALMVVAAVAMRRAPLRVL